mgnify:FL=1
MSISPIKQEAFEVDLSKDAQYGVIQFPIAKSTLNSVLHEISIAKLDEESAEINSQFNDKRKVKLWRVPIKGLIGKVITNVVKELNKTFNYRLSAIQDIQYLEYSVGDYYNPHSDISIGISAMRKISISWVLNEGFTGGELKIWNGGEEQIIVPTTEHLIAFTSFFTHAVTEVTQGTRCVLVCWINGEQWR